MLVGAKELDHFSRPEDTKLKIVDETLREGMQTPGLVFSFDEKVQISKLLDAVGVNGIMVGYPPAHKSEIEAVKAVAQLKKQGVLKASILGHGRTMKEDADLIAQTGSEIVLHFPFGFKPSNLELLDAIKRTISYTKDRYKGQLKIDLVDVASLELSDLAETAIAIGSAGADVISLPDTTGTLTPKDYYKIIKHVKDALRKEKLSCELAVHCHNDLGAALANTIVGVYAGANVVEVTVGGLGERNGIADLATTCAVLERGDFKTGIDPTGSDMVSLYTYVSSIVREKLQFDLLNPMFPVFGEFVSVHTAGTHAMSVPSSLLSRQWGFSLTVYTGRHALKKVTSKMGYELTEDHLGKLVNQVKDLSAEKCREVTLEELKQLISQLLESS